MEKNKTMKQNPHLSPKRKKQLVDQKKLVLINDDFNSFNHVIDCLVAICEHDPIQAWFNYALHQGGENRADVCTVQKY